MNAVEGSWKKDVTEKFATWAEPARYVLQNHVLKHPTLWMETCSAASEEMKEAVCMEVSEDRAMGRYGSLCLPHLLFWWLFTIVDSNDWPTYQDWEWWQLSQWWEKEMQMFPILLKPNNWFIGYPFLICLEDFFKCCAPSQDSMKWDIFST